MSADCVFAANIDMMSDFTSSVTGCESADNMDVKTRDESKLSMSVEALPNDDVVEVVRCSNLLCSTAGCILLLTH